jgi:hypothetical protein
LVLFYRMLIFIQAGVLTFWSLLASAQSISGERERKTWDFQRTTRLTSAELLVGKLLGEPILAYFIVLCCFPIALLAGLAGQVRLSDIASAYLMVIASALFIGLAGLWLSSLLESRSRGVGLIGALGLYAFVMSAYGFQETEFPGLGAFSPMTGLIPLLADDRSAHHFVARLFGAEVPWLLMSVLLYSTFGAWLVLMIVQNLKRDYDEVRPLSRWQAVGCAAFLNLILYLLFFPQPGTNFTAQNFVTTMVVMNALILFAVGLATLTPHEHLKLWWRTRSQNQRAPFSKDGLPWPWILLSAVVAYALLVWGLFAWRHELPWETNLFWHAAVQSLVACIFVTRDVLFIQWCKLTRLRSPVIKGFLYLCLYYAASGILAVVFAIRSDELYRRIINILTPAGVFGAWHYESHLPGIVLLGMVLQLVVIGMLLRAIARRLSPSPAIQTAAAD